jgi:SEC-C motif-containing protein
MRSRYTAFVVGDRDHLLRSWHPATRPDDLALDPDMRWRGLTIVFAEEDAAGGSGVVRFRARWSAAGENGVLEERSRFARRAGRWVYLDGEVS